MREFIPADYLDLLDWCKKRQIQTPSLEDLPRLGLILPGLAIGFLIATDTNTAIIDFLISNPDANAFSRGRAIDDIIGALMARAAVYGFKRIRCDSQIDTVKRKARALGFRDLGRYGVFCKEI